MKVGSYWGTPQIINDEPLLIVDSTQYYDDKEDTCTTPRDRKNMRIADNSRVNKVCGCTSNSGNGGGNKECTVKIDPDKTNKLENRKNGLYVPPLTWETLT